jgi:hypothetical protein
MRQISRGQRGEAQFFPADPKSKIETQTKEKMKRKILTTALVALAGLTLLSQSVQAQLTYSADDLFIGFQKAGSLNSYVINIGQASLYNLPGASFTLSSGSIGADLTAVFGSGWATDASLYWGVAGTPGSSIAGGDQANTLYASKAESLYGTQETPYNRAINQNIPRAEIVNFTSSYAGAANATNPKGMIQSTSIANDWQEFNNSSGTSFGYFDGLEGNFAAGVGGTALDLFRMQSGSTALGTYRGTFTINGSGLISFSGAPPSAVPEPSTYAMLALGALLMTVVIRRKADSVLV